MKKGLKTRWMEVLGYAGLIPFLGLGILSVVNRDTDLASMFGQWNLLYGATIVSFLGAVHWGIVLTQASADQATYLAGRSDAGHEAFSFVWGVTPSLIAWLIVAFAPADWSLWLMALTLWLVWIVDRKALAPLKAFDDYLRLRTHLTVGASIGLLVTAASATLV